MSLHLNLKLQQFGEPARNTQVKSLMCLYAMHLFVPSSQCISQSQHNCKTMIHKCQLPAGKREHSGESVAPVM